MLASIRTAPSAIGAQRRATRVPQVAMRAYSNMNSDDEAVSYSQGWSSTAPGDKLRPWISSPFDILAFGPRVGAGALISIPQRLQSLQYDVQRLQELVQDPRPINEKQEALFKEVETVVVEFLERGATVEQDVLSNVKTLLPSDAANLIDDLIPKPPNATSTTTSTYTYEPEPEAPPAPIPNYGQDDVLAQQISSEITEIRNAVTGLKGALDAVRANADVASTSLLKLNLKEARDQLQRRLAEVSPSTANDPTVSSATREGRILLDEVNAMFFY